MVESCPSCKSTNLESGSVTGAAIQLARASAMKKALAAPEILATVCLDCGAIGALRAEPMKLAKMLGR